MTGTPPEREKPDNKWKSFLKRIFKVATNNLGYKAIALVLAAFTWSILIAQDPSITREKVISDVTATISGTDSLKRNGFVVINDLTEQVTGITLRTSVPQTMYQTVTASNYSPRIDLSRITSAGEQEVKILTSNSSMYGTVLDVSPSTVTVQVDELLIRNRIPVVRETIGSVPNGWYATNGTLDPSTLTISGPKSIVEQVVRAVVVQDLSSVPGQEGTLRTALTFQLEDINGDPVESDALEITSNSVLLDTVIVEQTVYPCKSLTFSDIGVVVGKPADGYEIKSVNISPRTIVAAGKSGTLNNLENVFTDATVDVNNRTESFSQTVRIRKPSELNYLSQESVTIAVEIGEIISERTFTDVRIHVTNVESGHGASLVDRYADLVVIEGPLNWLDSLKSSQLVLTVDASGLMAGEYEVPVILEITGDEGVSYGVKISPNVVKLTVREQ